MMQVNNFSLLFFLSAYCGAMFLQHPLSMIAINCTMNFFNSSNFSYKHTNTKYSFKLN